MSRLLVHVLLVLNAVVYPLQGYNYGEEDGANDDPYMISANPPDPHIPGEHTMDINELQKILGYTEDDLSWVSIGEPSQIYEPGVKSDSGDQRLDVLLSFRNYTLEDDQGSLIDANPNIVQAVRRWMVKEATCGVDYLWKRLDASYWPFWVKHVFCSSSESCSWPPGMTCQPVGVRTVKLLQWTCLSDPLSTKLNAFRESVMEDQRKMAMHRMKRRSQRRRLFKDPNRSNGVLRPKRRKRMLKQYAYRTSKYAHGFLCQWSPVEYSISESCSCNCSR